MTHKIDTVLVVAAETEAEVVLTAHGLPTPASGEPTPLTGGLWLLQTGIGKANAAGTLGIALGRHQIGRVISLGIGGSLPDSGIGIGERVLASRSVFADEGIETPSGFLDCRSLGFPLYEGDRGDGLEPDGALVALIEGVVDRQAVVATVSTCSGRDDLALRVRRRTGAGVEAMEGAAVMLTCRRLGVPGAEIRVISNTTGDRDRQVWDIGRALRVLGETSRALSDVLAR